MAADKNNPVSFSAVTERYPWHDALWSVLARQFEQLPHALLLQGRPGLGKHDFAVQLAQALLCEQTRDSVACGEVSYLPTVPQVRIRISMYLPSLSGWWRIAESITIDQNRALVISRFSVALTSCIRPRARS